MNDHQNYIKNRMRIGWALLALGVLLFAAGLVLQYLFTAAFNARIVSGLGIFFAGLGFSQIIRYRIGAGNRQAVDRLVNEERDERNRLIRARAGNRAFWVALVMIYIALMWLSFASNGDLPNATADVMWYYLAAAFVIPFGVYIIDIIVEQRNS